MSEGRIWRSLGVGAVFRTTQNDTLDVDNSAAPVLQPAPHSNRSATGSRAAGNRRPRQAVWMIPATDHLQIGLGGRASSWSNRESSRPERDGDVSVRPRDVASADTPQQSRNAVGFNAGSMEVSRSINASASARSCVSCTDDLDLADGGTVGRSRQRAAGGWPPRAVLTATRPTSVPPVMTTRDRRSSSTRMRLLNASRRAPACSTTERTSRRPVPGSSGGVP